MLWVRREAHWAQDSCREAREAVDWGPGTHRVGGREGRQLKGRHSWVRESLGRQVREGARSLHCCLGEVVFLLTARARDLVRWEK